MNICVCISKTPDTTTKIKFTSDHKSLDAEGVQWIINPYDDHALAAAIELREKQGGEITVIHVGEASSDPVIRKALAIGADKAIRINTKPADAFSVAKMIANTIKDKEFDIVFTGRESIDFNGNVVCDLLGEFLDMPSVSFVRNLELNNNEAIVKRFIDGGSEKLKTKLPLVISAAKELAEPKIPNMRGIMQARSKQLDVVEPGDVSVPTEYLEFEPPKPKGECTFIEPENAEELIDILHNKEKVI